MQFIDYLKWSDYKKFLSSDTLNFVKEYLQEYPVESLQFSGSKAPS